MQLLFLRFSLLFLSGSSSYKSYFTFFFIFFFLMPLMTAQKWLKKLWRRVMNQISIFTHLLPYRSLFYFSSSFFNAIDECLKVIKVALMMVMNQISIVTYLLPWRHCLLGEKMKNNLKHWNLDNWFICIYFFNLFIFNNSIHWHLSVFFLFPRSIIVSEWVPSWLRLLLLCRCHSLFSISQGKRDAFFLLNPRVAPELWFVISKMGH